MIHGRWSSTPRSIWALAADRPSEQRNHGTPDRFRGGELRDWDAVLNVNARSAFLFTRWALGSLRGERGGVVNVASVAARWQPVGLLVLIWQLVLHVERYAACSRREGKAN
jgi:NAD(P)-dependent dehydrogenase (short-subunit alcohol dehydrogenase family)